MLIGNSLHYNVKAARFNFIELLGVLFHNKISSDCIFVTSPGPKSEQDRTHLSSPRPLLRPPPDKCQRAGAGSHARDAFT